MKFSAKKTTTSCEVAGGPEDQGGESRSEGTAKAGNLADLADAETAYEGWTEAERMYERG